MSDSSYYDDGIIGASDTEGWDEQSPYVAEDAPVYVDLSLEQEQLETGLGRELNGTELMALQNALDQGVEGTLSELYDMYTEIRGTPEGREALMKARLQELRDES